GSAFTFLVAAASASAAVVRRDLAALQADIVSITTLVNKLDTDINAFPNTGGTVAGALAIHTDAVNVENAVNKGTTDAKALTQLSESDGQSVYNSVAALKPTILDALTVIVQKKPAFDALPLGGISTIVKNDLGVLRTDVANFGTALIAIAPDDLKDSSTTLKNDIDAAFGVAITAYGG
ncbi:hydrophobic surface binding protein, partial [Flagelloscypha sp. PMI_526]